MAKLPYTRTAHGISVIINGRPYSIAVDEPHYEAVVSAIKTDAPGDEVLAILEKEKARLTAATAITENISVRDGVVLFQGAVVDNKAAVRMLRMLDEGFDLKPMARFLENLLGNPSYRAVTSLYEFLEYGNMPITEDGHFLAYKAVRQDYLDIHSGTFDNSVGQIVSMPRNKVNEDPSQTCSAGLHVCSFDYLPHFANANGHVMVCKINPADVVAIPTDYQNTKMRVSKYEVVDEYMDYYRTGQAAWDTSVVDKYSDDEYVDGMDGLDDDETYVIQVFRTTQDFNQGLFEKFDEGIESLEEAKETAITVPDPWVKIVIRQESDDVVKLVLSA